MKKENLNDFLKTLTYGMTYHVLEEASEKEEIEKIGKKHHLKLPAKDLSLFKCIYAYVDQENLNGCTLPKQEVEKALATLNGKSIDFDHLRKKIVGYWLEGSLENDSIVAYGVFFKGSLTEEYEEIRDLFNQGKLKISMEAWGTKEFTSADKLSYELSDIEFAGGALLINTDPAFPGTKVLEMANMKEPSSFVKSKSEAMSDKKNKYLEKSKFFVSDMDYIMRSLSQVKCSHCDEEYTLDIESIDFANGKADTTCYMCEGKTQVNFMPKAKKVEKASEEVFKITEIIKIEKKNLEESNKMEEKIKELEAKLAEFASKLEAKETELATATAKIEEVSKQLEESKAIVEASVKEKEEAVKIATENATKVANRRAELLDFAKELKDEDLLDDKNYEIAKLKKEKAELEEKVKSKETASVQPAGKEELTVGTKEKRESDLSAKQKKIDELAFGKQA